MSFQRCYKFGFFRTLGMPDHISQKWEYQLMENFDVYLYAKNQFYPELLPWDIAKIL